MDFPFQLDLSEKGYYRVMDILCPFLIGGTLVVGILLVRPDIRKYFFSIPEVSYHAKLAVLILLFFAFGYTFWAAVDFSLFWTLTLVNRITKNRLGARLASSPPWQSRTWQLVASEMLGQTLAPAKLSRDLEEEIKAAKADVEQIGDSNKKQFEMENVRQLESALEKDVRQWCGWYAILKAYYELPTLRTRESFYAFGTVHALGWVGILLAILSRHFSWLVVVAGLGVAYGIWGHIYRMQCAGYLSGPLHPDNQVIPLTVEILRDVREGPLARRDGNEPRADRGMRPKADTLQR